MKSNDSSVHVLLVTFQFPCVKSARTVVPGFKITASADLLHRSVVPPGGTIAERYHVAYTGLSSF